MGNCDADGFSDVADVAAATATATDATDLYAVDGNANDVVVVYAVATAVATAVDADTTLPLIGWVAIGAGHGQ